MFNPQVFVLARGKSCNKCISAQITKRLNRAGIDAYRVTPNANPRFRPENVRVVINYGTSARPIWWHRLPSGCVILNEPEQVATSANKVHMTAAMRAALGEDHILPSVTTRAEAQAAIDSGNVIVARTVLSGHSGKGIVLSPPNPLPDARLYTVLTRRRGLREYRLYMYDGQFIDIVQKKRMTNEKLVSDGWCTQEQVSQWWTREREVIRSYWNGWAFCHQNLDVDDQPLFDEIAQATARLINWGCVDLLIDSRTRQWYAIETNTAPGLDGETTFSTYIDKFAAAAVAAGVVQGEYNTANYKEYTHG